MFIEYLSDINVISANNSEIQKKINIGIFWCLNTNN